MTADIGLEDYRPQMVNSTIGQRSCTSSIPQTPCQTLVEGPNQIPHPGKHANMLSPVTVCSA